MLAPLRRAFGVALHASLFGKWLRQHVMQALHLAVVPGLRRIDGFLCQIVAQDIQRVDRVHAFTASIFILYVFTGNPGQVLRGSVVKALEVDKFFPQAGDGLLGGFVAQMTEKQGVVDAAALHLLQQCFD